MLRLKLTRLAVIHFVFFISCHYFIALFGLNHNHNPRKVSVGISTNTTNKPKSKLIQTHNNYNSHARPEVCSCPALKHWRLILEEWELSSRMVMLGACSFHMGSNSTVAIRGDKEMPIRRVTLENPFWIDKTEVTTNEFLKFFRATGHRTTAEVLGSSFVFSPRTRTRRGSKKSNSNKNGMGPYSPGIPASVGTGSGDGSGAGAGAGAGAGDGGWWIERKSVTWASDLPPSKIKKVNENHLLSHPVTHVSWEDAITFCLWRQGFLPTESQWEYACRGGLENCLYPWGDLLRPNGTYMANIWQGQFPLVNTAQDGFEMAAPVASFPPNGFGLYDMVGNVWEWVFDSWSQRRMNLKDESDSNEIRVQKGGSFMCHRNHCFRYRCGARTRGSWDSTSSNLGFRCVHSLNKISK